MAHRIPEPARVRVLREFAPIRKDLPITSAATLVKQRHHGRGLDHAVRPVEHLRRTARQAVRNGIVSPEIRDTLLEDGFRRRSEDGFVLRILYQVETVRVCFGPPQAGQIGLAIGCSGHRSCQVRFTVGGPRNTRRAKVEPLSAQCNWEQP